MKIEPGKFYRTRDGRQVRVYAVDGPPDYPIHGAVLPPTETWACQIWYEDGRGRQAADDPWATSPEEDV